MSWLHWKRRSPAWQAWADGDIARASELSGDLPRDEGIHLRLLLAVIDGRYAEALEARETLSPRYRRRGDVKQLEQDIQQWQRTRELCSVALAETTIVPFANHPLAPFFPAFAVEINGEKRLARVDIGAPYLLMSPEQARRLGIDLDPAGCSGQGYESAAGYTGLAGSFRIGDAVLENVPVVGLSMPAGERDFVHFGTNVLEQFLATLDYPRRR
jgi:Aspartyl protease